MSTVPAPTNVKIFRSEDRTSALLAWDSMPRRRVYTGFDIQYKTSPYDHQLYYNQWCPQQDNHTPAPFPTNHMTFGLAGSFTGDTPGTYRLEVVSTVSGQFFISSVAYPCTTAIEFRIKKDGVIVVPSLVMNVGSMTSLVDGLRGQLFGAPFGFVVLVGVGYAWEIDVVATSWIDVEAAAHYNVQASERANGLGYVAKKTVTPNPDVLRQYTVVDGLDPDQHYNFRLTTTDTEGVTGEPSEAVSDF